MTRGRASKRAAPQPIVMAQVEEEARVVIHYSGSNTLTGTQHFSCALSVHTSKLP